MVCTLFYQQHFYKLPGRNWEKFKQKLSNTLRLNFCYLKIFRVLQLPHRSKIMGNILKKKTSVPVLVILYD